MADAAKIGADLGAAIIDINMGCPARKVTGKLSGSALMREETLVAEIFAAVRKAVDIPVTVKMRLGWDDQMLNARIWRISPKKKALPWLLCMAGHAVSFIKGRRIGRPYDVSVRLFPSRFSSMVISTRLPMLIRLSQNPVLTG